MKIYYLVFTLLLIGCMPDSLTKFKKDEAKASTSSTSSASSSGAAVSGGSGAAAGPTSWNYAQSGTTITTTNGSPLILYIGTAMTEITPVFSGYDSDEFEFTIYAYDATALLSNCTPITATTSAPTGIAFDTSTGVFSGTPTAYVDGDYTIKAEHLASGDTSCVHLFMAPITNISYVYFAQLEDRSPAAYNPAGGGGVTATGDYLAIKIDSDTTNFTVGKFLIDSENEIVAEIKSVDSTNKILNVQIRDQKNNALTDLFEIGDKVDYVTLVGDLYVSKKALITEISYIFQVHSSALDDQLRPMIYKSSNGTMSTSLPESASTTFVVTPSGVDVTYSSTGVLIDGNPAELEKTEHVFEIIRHGETYTQSSYLSITNLPQDLSIANMLILPTNLTAAQAASYFPIGKNISSSGTGKGQVIRAYKSGDTGLITLVVLVSEGTFLNAQTIDNFTTYGTNRGTISAEPSVISDIISVPIADKAAALTYITSSTADNYGVIEDYYDDTLYSDGSAGPNTTGYLLVRMARGNLYDDANVNQNEYIAITPGGTSSTVSPTYAAGAIDIGNIWSKFVYLYDSATPWAAGAFNAGTNISSSTGAASIASGSATIMSKNVITANDILVEMNSYTPIEANSNVDDMNPYVAAVEINEQVRTAPEFVAYRGDKFTLFSDVTYGSSIIYSVSPTLPTGLTLDQATGILTGTPTEPSARATYTLTASNGIGNETYTFYLEVKDQFNVLNTTANASSYILHKSGLGNFTAGCRVTQDQIDISLSGTEEVNDKDILCLLEAGELDLYFSGITLKSTSGFGMCEYVRFKPFKFWRYEYNITTPVAGTYYVHNFGTCGTGTTPTCAGGLCTVSAAGVMATTAGTDLNACLSDYTTQFGSDYPNCDDGSYHSVTWSDTDANGDCEPTIPIALTSCGGEPGACYAGPVLEQFSTAQLTLGIDSTLYSSFAGFNQSWSFISPLTKGNITNKRLANFTIANSAGGSYTYNSGASHLESQYLFNTYQWDAYAAVDASGVAASPFSTLDGYDVSPYYEYECLDYAQDLIARIRVVVRDWDRTFTPASNSSDKIIEQITGTAAFAAASPVFTGVGTNFNDDAGDFDNELPISPAYAFSNLLPATNTAEKDNVGVLVQVINIGAATETARVTSITDDTTITLTSNAVATIATNNVYRPPLLMDSGTTTDVFGQAYNDRKDWDDIIGSTATTMPRYSDGDHTTPSANQLYAFPGLGL